MTRISDLKNQAGGRSNLPDRSINDQYFSGTQASLFIGDTWVDDIVDINYRVMHDRQPIYGYGSQHFDFVPKGTILVAGEFTINFREPNYLWMILSRYKAFNSGTTTVQDKSIGNISNPSRKRNEKIEEQINEFNATFAGDPRRNLDYFLAANESDAKFVQQTLQNKLTGKTSEVKKPERFNHGIFAITLGYGELNSETVGERINFVQIMGKGKQINLDGRPVMETYSFIARDIS